MASTRSSSAFTSALTMSTQATACWRGLVLIVVTPAMLSLSLRLPLAALFARALSAQLAVERFLEDASRLGGPAVVEQLWERIWMGFVAFATVGTLDADLARLLLGDACTPTALDALAPSATRSDLEARLVDLIRARAPHARLLHTRCVLHGRRLVDLFDDPPALLAALVDSGRVVPGDPDHSPFLDLLTPMSVMYKVFTPEEIRLWRAWITHLGDPALPAFPKDIPGPAEEEPSIESQPSSSSSSSLASDDSTAELPSKVAGPPATTAASAWWHWPWQLDP